MPDLSSDFLMALAEALSLCWWPLSFKALLRAHNGDQHSVPAYGVHLAMLSLNLIASVRIAFFWTGLLYAIHITCTIAFIAAILIKRRQAGLRMRAEDSGSVRTDTSHHR